MPGRSDMFILDIIINNTDPIANALGNWSIELSTAGVLLKLVITILLSAVIGCERATKRHSAGLRTFVLVSLSCTMCPELVTALQRVAALNPNITAQVYDLNHFPEIKDKYNVMSVPCLVVNDGQQISFGKKNASCSKTRICHAF